MNAEAPRARTTPGDLARWLFWVKLREALDPERPGQLSVLDSGWRAWHFAAGPGRQLMVDEYRRCFGELFNERGYRSLVRDAYRAAWRVHMGELLLGKLDEHSVDHYIRFEGLERLDAALARGKGVVWVYPHAGAVMLMLAGLALHGYPYTQYAARGLAPEDVARDHPELLAANRWREAVRRAREEAEDRTPAKFLTLSAPTRELFRRLNDNELIGLAYDGRIGAKWWPVDYLGRKALLNPGPWRLAANTGAAVVPAFCHTPVEGPAVCVVGEPIFPEGDWEGVGRAALAQLQAWLRCWPEEYGVWLLHCRLRNNIDDHPLFVDHAVDERWRKWLEE